MAMAVTYRAPLANLPGMGLQPQPAALAPRRRRCRAARPAGHLPHAPPAAPRRVDFAETCILMSALLQQA